MSIVLITQHDESIYRILDKEKKYKHNSINYVSKLNQKARAELKKNKSDHKTMGFAEVPMTHPSDYLKKGSRICPPRPVVEHRCYTAPRPPIPRREELRSAGAKPQKPEFNWTAHNVKSVVNAKTTFPIPRYVDKHTGDTFRLEHSGVFPGYIYSEKYGKTPNYLLRFLKESKQAKQNEHDTKSRTHPPCRYIPQEDRERILEGLKENWAILQKQFNRLPLLTDNAPKVMQKAQLEKELRTLEKDILRIEEHPFIYVYDGDN